MGFYFELGYCRKIPRRVTNAVRSYLLVWLLRSNNLVYNLAIGFDILNSKLFWLFSLFFHVYLSDSFKACQLLYFNWKIDVLRFFNTCLNGFCAIFHFLSWHLSSAKWKIRTMLTYNLSIISLFWLRGIISLHSLIADPDYWLWSLFYLLASCCFHLNHDSFYPFRWFDNFWCFLFGSAWLTSSVWSCDVRFSERHCHFDATLLLEDPFFFLLLQTVVRVIHP